MILNLYFYYLILILSLIKNNSSEKILFAFQMNRHGARAPYLGVTNGIDIYKEKWTQIEELSDVGRRMLYLLGVKVRKRYIKEYKLLSENYNPQEIYIKSTDSNRTIESIYSFLQGLYPAGTGPTINNKVLNITNITYPPNKKYQNDFENILNVFNMSDNGTALPYQLSIQPVHIFYLKDHEIDLHDTRVCFGDKKNYEERQRRKEIFDFVDKIMNETNNLFMELEETNNYTFLRDYWTLYKYMDGFLCDDTDIRSFEYMKNKYGIEIIDKLRKYSKDFLDMDYFETNFPENVSEVGIVSNSFTIHSLLNWMKIAINNYENNNNQYLKYVIFSAHDSTIGSMESFLRYAFNSKMESCSFADSRYFELYIDDNGNYKVRYLKGDNNIKFDIAYEHFRDVSNEKTWSDEKVSEFCQFEENSDNHEKKEENEKEKNEKEKKKDKLGIAFMIVLIVLNAILIFFIIFISCKGNNYKN